MTSYNSTPQLNPARIISLAAIVFAAIILLISATSLVEVLDSTDVMVVQYPSGSMHVFTQPGPHLQLFGTVTKYKKQSSYSFSSATDQGKGADESLPIQFADGAHAKISGTILWQMPASEDKILAIHRFTGSHEAVEQKYIRPVIQKAIYFTGPLMTAKESYSERKTDLLSAIEDQIAHGVYKTVQTTKRDIDPLTGAEKIVTLAAVATDDKGQVIRQDQSPLAEFDIRTYNLAVNHVDYDPKVEEQIQKQQQIAMDVQTAIAEAKKAEQRALTVAKQGEADAAKAKWEQEVIKAKQVTEAEAQLEVAKRQNDVAEQYRQGQLKRADADATYRKRVMEADGALQQRLDALVKINEYYAIAIKESKNSLVPNVTMGQGGEQGGNGIANLINLLTVQTMKQVGLHPQQ